MGQEINTNKANITNGEANNQIDAESDARANIDIPNQKQTSPR